ncbi:MAG: chemotaxis protein CheW [Methanoregula sp.]|nr:chemotaxis protein CheW [Methanoregula sp.]
MADIDMLDEYGDEEIETDQYLIFNIDTQNYGIQAIRILEIAQPLKTTEVPEAPAYVDGIINLRGKLATVINFRKKFGFPEKPKDEDTRVVIVEQHGFPIGIIVDYVDEVIKIPDSFINKMPPGASTTHSQRYIKGLGLMDNKLSIILDVDAILESVDTKGAEEFIGAINHIQNMDVAAIPAAIPAAKDQVPPPAQKEPVEYPVEPAIKKPKPVTGRTAAQAKKRTARKMEV